VIEGQECISLEGSEFLSPEAKWYVQDFYARKFLAEVEPHQPERRRAMRLKFRRRGWGKVWPVNDVEYRTTRDVTLDSWRTAGVTAAESR
jgi:hypothetical protein